MNNEFKSFGRKSDNPNFNRPDNAVLYTRVSTSEQTDNYSLENQLEKCLECVERLNLKGVEKFGGTHDIIDNPHEKCLAIHGPTGSCDSNQITQILQSQISSQQTK